MKAEVITIGSELLLGTRPETNSLFLVDELGRLGIQVRWKTVVGDEEEDIAEALKCALQRNELVITTGGLGSTLDDLTRRIVAKVTHRRLVLKEDLLAKMPKGYEKQALLPARAQVLKNPVGTVPGFMMEVGECHLVVLPGIPYEMKRIFTDSVKGLLQKLVRGARPFHIQVIRTFGLTEAQANEALIETLKDLTGESSEQCLGLVAGPTGVDIYLRGCFGPLTREISILERFKASLRKRLGEAIYSEEGRDMEEVVGFLLKKRGLKLAVAESCTGGLIGHRLTNIPGSSAYFERGVVCYSDQSKVELLGVLREMIARFGAVSAQVASALAKGVRGLAKTDLGLGVTGIAGPGGGTPSKPVGLVHMALAYGAETWCESFQFRGDRGGLKLSFSQAGLDLVRRHLLHL